MSALQSLRFGATTLQTLSDDLNLPDRKRLEQKNIIGVLSEQIVLRELCFNYEEGHDLTIDRVDLRIAKGEFIGIIGTTGAGKSTLVDLILGLLKPSSGTVEIDGVDIHVDLAGWQKNIGYVPQSIFLMDETISTNVAFGIAKNGIDDASVNQALRAAQLYDFVQTLPKGVDTVIGERGAQLSGGQRQRLGIARALYQNPMILVLDEATSSLDIQTERSVMNAIEGLHGEKTIIVVTHRLSTVADCDQVIMLDQGKIVSYGDYETVMKSYLGKDYMGG